MTTAQDAGRPDVSHAEIRAAAESRGQSDEGEFPPLIDLLGFSGENAARIAIRAALEAAARVRAYRPSSEGDAASEVAEVKAPWLFGPVRHMDEIDAAQEVGPWLDEIALALPRIANEQITLETADAGIKVYWRENQPHALVLTIRDGMNFTFGVGINFARAIAAETALAAAREVLSRDDIQWASPDIHGRPHMCAICCGGKHYEGHTADCRLAAALADAPRPAERTASDGDRNGTG